MDTAASIAAPGAGTRHHGLLNSNEPPLDSDLFVIKSTSSQIEARMLALDEEIAPLRRRLEQLVDERQALVRLRCQNSAIISPLRRIPPEVLAEIFTWTLPATWLLSERDRFSCNDSPWLLTHVSRGWRATAISTSSLWSLVVVDYPPHVNPAGLYPLSMLETHISRAKKLKIHFYGNEDSDHGPQTEVFRYLASHSSRWEELSLGLTSALVPLLGILQNRIPSLRRLSLQWFNETSQDNVDSIDCFYRAPCLVDFTIFNEFRPVPVRVPIQQLTCYRADNSWESHQGVLALGLNLVELRVHIAFDDEPWPDVRQIIHLPRLRRLYVSAPEILDYLVAPALDEIGLRFWSGGDEIDTSFGAFVERSGCNLWRLCLNGCVEPAILAPILKATTSITELAIIKAPGGNETVNALITMLTMTPQAPPIAPQLQSISLACERGSSLPRSLCLAMIHSRWKQPHRVLTTAALLSGDLPGPLSNTLDDLKMRQEGLDLLVQEGRAAEKVIGDWTYHPIWV